METSRVEITQEIDSAKKTKKLMSKSKRNDYFWAYVMILPTLAGTLIFNIWPLLQSFYLSFTEWGGFGTYTFGGLVNYKRLFHDTELLGALKNTVIFTALSVPLGISISIFVAVLLNQKIRGMTIYRTLYFIPVVTMPAAVAIVWKWLYNSDYGLINYLLRGIGIKGLGWLTDPNIALYSLVCVAVWGAVGYNMVIILSGLQGIPKTFYEAAEIDGATPFVRFFRITLPLLTPTLFFVTVMSLINTFQMFELVYMMVGPNSPVIQETQTLVYLFYKQAFINNDKGYAAAISLFIFVIILIFTILQFRLQKKWVHYE
ncbi:carbohydrate ABC transporter permease [Neobacillus cucumis]|uniref:Sugar ABC transporter permease n=1 Tax=Neobacillus cucumis TaxID=1740721 RepID=A0A2N5HIK7_9BACI|nr:sugar ABC transporter permease [Neobacillus cucumis]PLS05349.1 sugar ABC transporter permease [Neobacillus cucumis]